MATPYIGEVRAVAFPFTPEGWASCNGQLLNISEYSALFQLLGTTYGGDGQTTFAVPNLNSRVVVGAQNGQAGSGLSSYQLGLMGGSEGVTLTTAQMPAHAHAYTGSLGGSTAGPLSDNPAGRRPGVPTGGNAYAGTSQSGQNLAATAAVGTSSVAGGSQPHYNIQPVQVLNFIICLEGLYPPSS